MTGFFRAAARRPAAPARAHAVRAGRDDRARAVRAGEGVSGAPVLMPADIRFPLERANGVQIVKTAAALAASGHGARRCFVRRSDPRPTAEMLALYGVDAGRPAGGAARRASGTARGSFALPRPRFLARAGLAGLAGPAPRRRRVHARPAARRPAPARVRRDRSCTRRTRWRRSCTASAARSTARREAPDPRQGRRASPRREARVWRAGRGLRGHHRGIRDSFDGRARAARAHARDPERLRRARGPRVPRPRRARRRRAIALRGPALSVEGRRRAGARHGGRAGRAARDPGRARGRGGRASAIARAGRGARPRRAARRCRARCRRRRWRTSCARAAVVVAPFLHTAMTERHTSPLKAFEAMAAGRPLVASDLPAQPRVPARRARTRCWCRRATRRRWRRRCAGCSASRRSRSGSRAPPATRRRATRGARARRVAARAVRRGRA